ncbi:MAG: hypothetical protein WAN71_03880, partial [Mycobacterium sp.]|uniref:hypothetical protein n=1 Tax=Mycobacterium sp. TaxID=1785 RepID=UPI003BAFB910
MRKAIISAAVSAALAVAVLTMGIVPIVGAPVATADGVCDYGHPGYDNVGCYYCEKAHGMNPNDPA